MRRYLATGLLICLFAFSFLLRVGADDKKNDGFVPLFNGKDLTGWKMHPRDKARWKVEDGAIIGEGPAGHLFTERGDYTNFHLRFEAMINDKGNSGQYFRADFAP